MKVIPVKVKSNSYKILIGHRILPQLGAALKAMRLGPDAVIVTNPVVSRYYGKTLLATLKKSGFNSQIFTVPDSERSKSVKVAFGLIEKIARIDTQKKIFIVAFGGGVVGDLAGYVAATYKRGIPYVQVPTTLLAQIDSAIGGKVAIDLSVGKNLVGAFYQPKLVLSDVALLRSLDKRQIRNGLAEAVKYGIIRDHALFCDIEKNYQKILALKPEVINRVVVACSKIKADVVRQDEKETRGIRTILNFGHTLGHAIETAGHFQKYQHGEAVALGMRIAAQIAFQRRMLKASDALRIERLLSAIGLPSLIKGISLPAILKAMGHDKKFKAKKNCFVLPVRIGAVKVVEGVSQGLIRQSVKERMPLFRF